MKTLGVVVRCLEWTMAVVYGGLAVAAVASLVVLCWGASPWGTVAGLYGAGVVAALVAWWRDR